MGKLINIDNGGTLTDICVLDGDQVWRTKTLTTPFDLSKCFFDGLVKASKAIYGCEDIVALLASTDHIRYSTTQGTNALVERKGQRLGLLLSGGLSVDALRHTTQAAGLLADLVGERSVSVDLGLADEALASAAVRAVNALASAGANRIVVAHGGHDRLAQEQRLKKIFLRAFPQHLLGAIPLLYSHEVVEDDDDVRRAWTTIFNAFLHPAMERFLYNAEHKLRTNKAQNPLLIFRNDGHSARVAKTIALKTYSSGPRGGMEGARALAAHYGFEHLVSIDIGGTTTDIGEVRAGAVREDRHGQVEGVAVSFPLCNVVSVGVGGSSIIRVENGAIRVGPESVGSAPGPACFGLGGTQATITDAFLLSGLLDPESFFGGELKIDAARARSAVETHLATPLGTNAESAVARMEQAWVAKVADSIRAFTAVTPQTTLAAFGGAGPFVVCRVAEAAGISRVLIPGLAAVFSAFGLGFSDIAHSYEAAIAPGDDLAAVVSTLTQRVRRGMHAEGFALEDCTLTRSLRIASAQSERVLPLGDSLPALQAGERAFVSLTACKPIAQPSLRGKFGAATTAAVSRATRAVLLNDKTRELPLYRVEDQCAGAAANGPAVLEEAFFTCRIDAGWRFEVNDAGDVLLSKV
ncbi:hydantoinase/oxoprolinase family protein [Panacagrimonas sp.]|uniref:hydantoinase/oxoprolinase family protein n=1 Tax=Panacagrimonas sp. TaxID=2480088 RepID=UPI003B52527B